jgi:methylglutaconyl-CoA hydratase
MSDQVLQVERRRGVATLTLDSPANRNALSRAMRAQLRSALTEVIADDSVRVVVLDHTGRVFCSGMDLTEAAGGAAEEQGVNEFPALLEMVWDSPKPVVGVVRGPARAGGVGLLAACDVVVAAEAATFAFTEVRIGIAPAVISAVVLPRMVPSVAHRLLLTGEVFEAPQALAGGLVDLVASDAHGPTRPPSIGAAREHLHSWGLDPAAVDSLCLAGPLRLVVMGMHARSIVSREPPAQPRAKEVGWSETTE